MKSMLMGKVQVSWYIVRDLMELWKAVNERSQQQAEGRAARAGKRQKAEGTDEALNLWIKFHFILYFRPLKFLEKTSVVCGVVYGKFKKILKKKTIEKY